MTSQDRSLDTAAAPAVERTWSDVIGAVPAVIVIAPTVALSAFLMFSVEPLVGRLMLPVFGGAPGVWATVLAFFQAVLLLGYLYGHVIVTRLGIRRGALVHLAVVAIAVAALAISPLHVADLHDGSWPPALSLVMMLTATIGLPAFALTATTPLLSAWYHAIDSRVEGSQDPYWLYALSNAGSLAALLAYPFLIEPRLGLMAQRTAWAAGFLVLVVFMATVVAIVRVRVRMPASGGAAFADDIRRRVAGPASDAGGSTVDARRRLRWVLLAAVPSGLLAAVTNTIATDLVSAPLLWVGPLAIYLLSFVIAFSPRGCRLIPGLVWLAPVSVTLLWVPFGSAAGWPILPLLLLEYSGFGIIATALHGQLALDRPAPSHLTELYLLMALGGVLGGSFVALVAPVAFDGIWEYPILLVAALVALAVGQDGEHRHARAGVRSSTGSRAEPLAARRARRLDLAPFFVGAPGRLAAYLAVALPLAAALAASGSIGLEAGLRWLLVGGLVLFVGGQPRFLALATALVLILATFVLPQDALFRDRSFFGVTEVVRLGDLAQIRLMNGTTLHGVQSTDPASRDLPGSYYSRNGPIGDVFAVLDSADRATVARSRSDGFVGLGAGALATYGRPGDDMTFYEIDPVVVAVASDPRYFSYLADAAIPPRIVVGDARLTLAVVPDGHHDVLVLDAFSSDTIPAHLLTVEAFREYVRVLRPGGILAVHVSNRYYDLAPAVAAAAERVGMSALTRSHTPDTLGSAAGATPSIWVVASTDPAALAAFPARGWTTASAAEQPLTDDFADLLRFLRPLGG